MIPKIIIFLSWIGYISPLLYIYNIIDKNKSYVNKTTTINISHKEIRLNLIVLIISLSIVYILSLYYSINSNYSYRTLIGAVLIIICTILIHVKKKIPRKDNKDLMRLIFLYWIISIIEEIIFRIAPYLILLFIVKILNTNMNFTLITCYIIFTSFTFGIIHKKQGNIHMVIMIIFGIILGLAIIKFSILSSLYIHITYNFYVIPFEYNRINKNIELRYS